MLPRRRLHAVFSFGAGSVRTAFRHYRRRSPRADFCPAPWACTSFAVLRHWSYLLHIRAAANPGDSLLLDGQGEKARVSVDTQ